MNNLEFHLVIAAAGVGSRFGASTPKQYAQINEKPLLHHAIIACASHVSCASVTVALAADDTYWHAPIIEPELHTVTGGVERSDSVIAALQHLKIRLGRDDVLVLVHDAARPFVPKADLQALLTAATSQPDGAILAAPVADTLKQVDENGLIQKTVDRSQLWRALTPQAFRLGSLLAALEFCRAQAHAVTDEASALEVMGQAPTVVRANAANIKVTVSEDLALVSHYLESS